MAPPESQVRPLKNSRETAPTDDAAQIQQPARLEDLWATTTPFHPTASDGMAGDGHIKTGSRLDRSRNSIGAGVEDQGGSDSRTSTAPVYGARQSEGPRGSDTTISLHSPAPMAGARHGAWTPSPTFSNFMNATRHQPLSPPPEKDSDNDSPMSGTSERFDITYRSNDAGNAGNHNYLALRSTLSRPRSTKRTTMTAPRPSSAVHIFRQVVDLDHGVVTNEALHEAMELGDAEMSSELIHELRRTFTSAKEIEALNLFLSFENFEIFQSAGVGIAPAVTRGSATSAERDMTRGVERSSALAMPLSNRGEFLREARVRAEATELLRLIDSGTPTFTPLTPPSDEDSPVRDVSVVEDDTFDFPGVPSSAPELPKFPKFLALPPELRERIYEMVLYTGQAINPQLCSRKPDGAIKFHDANQHSRQCSNHNAINRLLGVTYVSKQIRAEALPCFYSANTFSVEADTATYFAHLEQMDRFHTIRHVGFSIPLRNDKWTAQILEQMTTYLKNVEIYERDHPHIQPYVITPTLRKYCMICDARVYTNLVEHPRHLAGGLNDMALFICLGMLSSAFTSSSNTANYTSSIALPVPSASTFTSYPRLQWFSSVSYGLGIHLHFVDGHELSYNHQAVIGVVWHQKFQKKDFRQVCKNEEAEDVTKRVEGMFPGVELAERKIWDRCSYMRTSCDGDRYTWFTVKYSVQAWG